MSEHISNDIAKLAELFAAGGFKELRVQRAGASVLLSNDRTTPPLGGSRSVAQVSVPVAAAPAAPVASPTAPAAPAAAVPIADDASWHQVCAPNLGTFYRSPKPGAAPFVEIGQRVDAETEICLLEVMKLFTSVKAGVPGTIRKVCVEDGVLVEGGQLLFLVETD